MSKSKRVHILSAQRLREVLEYSPETGLFVWLAGKSCGNHGTIKKCIPGSIAGSVSKVSGYLQIRVDRKLYYGHRLATLHMTGKWPESQVDHMDGVRSNNRWGNLRQATPAINTQNQRKAKSNNRSSGLLGVSRHGSEKLWLAKIKTSGNVVEIGRFETKEIAHERYLEAKRELHAGCTI